MGLEPRLAPTGRPGWGPVRKLVLTCLILQAIFLCLGCGRATGPELLEVGRITPGLVEPGVELTVSGRGFPEHRSGHAVFTGVVSAPGRAPERVTWPLEVVARSEHTLVRRLSQDELFQLTDGAPHVTFRGEVLVSFPPQRRGAPTLRGRSGPVVVDLLPESDRAGPGTPGKQFAQFLGLELAADLSVRELVPGSEAELAGLRVGDRLHELDGLHLLSQRDFVPAPRGLTSSLEFSREGFSGRGEALVARARFAAMDPRVAEKALLSGVAIALAVLLLARPPRLVLWLLGRPRQRRREPSSGELGAVHGAVGFSGTLLGLWLVLRGARSLELDLVLVLSAGILPLLAAGFLGGGADVRAGRFSFGIVAGLAGLLQTALGLLPVCLASAVAATTVGSLYLVDFSREQSMGPGSWLLLRSPGLLLLAVFYLLALVPRVGRRGPAEGLGAGGRVRRFSLAELLQALGRYVLVALWVLVFLGAGAAPGGEPWRAGLALSVKLGAVLLLLDQLARRSGWIRRTEGWSLFGLPLVALSLALSAGVVLVGASPWVGAAGAQLRTFSLGFAGAFAVLLGLAASRSLSHRGRGADPWI